MGVRTICSRINWSDYQRLPPLDDKSRSSHGRIIWNFRVIHKLNLFWISNLLLPSFPLLMDFICEQSQRKLINEKQLPMNLTSTPAINPSNYPATQSTNNPLITLTKKNPHKNVRMELKKSCLPFQRKRIFARFAQTPFKAENRAEQLKEQF